MPNTWSFTLLLNARPVNSKALVLQVLSAVERLGYRPYIHPGQPVYYNRTVVTPNGSELEELYFDDLESLYGYVFAHGGLMTVWKRDPEGGDWERPINLYFSYDPPRLDFWVLHPLTQKRDAGLTDDLIALFRSLCELVHPRYAYSSDDTLFEKAYVQCPGFTGEWAREPLEDPARHLQPGPLLFWLNYFEGTYWEALGAAPFAQVPHQVQSSAHGQFLLLGEAPWDARIAILGDDGVYRQYQR